MTGQRHGVATIQSLISHSASNMLKGRMRDPVLLRRSLLGGAATLAIGMARAASPKLTRRMPTAGAALPLVVLDPGHGGKDPGAIGVSGTYEKHIAFAAANELQRQLRIGRRVRVRLTREKDIFIPLEDRVGWAQRQGASLFISMHADAVSDHDVRGASIYTLSDVASDSQTAALARRENSADRFAGPDFHDEPPEVARILSSLVRQETRSGSARLQRSMVNSLDQELPMLQNPARHASFVVLKAADLPSILVEMGFMSNVRDEAALRRADHRAVVASAMMRAVDAFFEGTAIRMAG